uniref:Uncharacterized protein n=1 Tax=Molossus molossus TaxID=27622 RepID=A0A7J8JWP9_MOLMO|nr:hypothetical protein HJG59_007840 [Molossus molossus]
MFGGHVSAQDGKSDLEQPGIITPVVLLMEISKDGVILLVGVQICGTAPRSLTHTNTFYIYIYTCISSSLNLLLKFIYVTGWLDPKSCVYIFINKILPVPLLPFSLSLRKLKPCLVEYIIALVSFRDRIILSSKMSLMPWPVWPSG